MQPSITATLTINRIVFIRDTIQTYRANIFFCTFTKIITWDVSCPGPSFGFLAGLFSSLLGELTDIYCFKQPSILSRLTVSVLKQCPPKLNNKQTTEFQAVKMQAFVSIVNLKAMVPQLEVAKLMLEQSKSSAEEAEPTIILYTSIEHQIPSSPNIFNS